MTTTNSSFDENERDYLRTMLQKELYGAFLTACRVRKEEDGFCRTDLAARMSKDKAAITRLLQKHSNMTANTIAEFANAVEADIGFFLVDRKNRNRLFTGHGVDYCTGGGAGGVTISAGCFQNASAGAALNNFGVTVLPATMPLQMWGLMMSRIQEAASADVA